VIRGVKRSRFRCGFATKLRQPFAVVEFAPEMSNMPEVYLHATA